MSGRERRDVLKGLVAISAVGALAACGNGTDTAAPASTVSSADVKFAAKGAFFSVAEMAFLSALAQTIIPKTDVAGAVEAGVPETLQSLASNWANDDVRRYWRKGTRDLRAAFRKKTGQGFEKLSPEKREDILSPFDRDVFEGKIQNDFYRDMKSTIVQAFYMSEPGATEVLAYEPVPGDWKGCVPLSDYPKTWAT